MKNTDRIFNSINNAITNANITAKPSKNKQGIESWFPYYAGYSSKFIENVLNALNLPKNAKILDPWNGSGTTTSVADKMGFSAIGVDINPVATLVATARLVHPQDALFSEGFVTELLRIANRMKIQSNKPDALDLWLSSSLVQRFRSIEKAIIELLCKINGKKINALDQSLPPFASFLLLCLIRAAKSFIITNSCTNPTWMIPKGQGNASPKLLDEQFIQIVKQYSKDIELEKSNLQKSRASEIFKGDSRNLNIQDNSINAIVTSPPYCTRIDYFKATQFELAALGVDVNKDHFDRLRLSAMGTNLMRKEFNEVDLLSSEINELLFKIKNHYSIASKSYYYKQYYQYFHDATLSLSEIKRVLIPENPAVLIVQSSYYKDINVDLGALYCSMAKNLGMKAKVIHRMPVKTVIASMNKKAIKHLQDRSYFEDVVAIIK